MTAFSPPAAPELLKSKVRSSGRNTVRPSPTSWEMAAACWASPMSESATLDCWRFAATVELLSEPTCCRRPYFAAVSQAVSLPSDQTNRKRHYHSTASRRPQGRISVYHLYKRAGMMDNVSSGLLYKGCRPGARPVLSDAQLSSTIKRALPHDKPDEQELAAPGLKASSEREQYLPPPARRRSGHAAM